MSRPPVTVPTHETAILPAAPPPVAAAPSYGWERAQRGFAGGVVALCGSFCVAWPITDHLGVALAAGMIAAACAAAWVASWKVDPRDIRSRE